MSTARTLSLALSILAVSASPLLAAPSAVVVGGTATARDRATAAAEWTRIARGAGWTIADDAFAPADTAAALACMRADLPWPCLAKLARVSGLERIAAILVDPQPTDPRTIVITERIAVAEGRAAFVGQRFCDHCTDDTLASLTGELTRELLDRIAAGSGRAVLAIRSTPASAKVAIDGTPVGATDTVVDVAPGPHTVTIELDGYEPASRVVDTVEGHTADVAVALRRPPAAVVIAPPLPPPPRRRSSALSITVVGIGAALIASGAVVLALDEDPVSGPSQHASRHYLDTTAPGLALIVGGAVVAGSGGFWWWKSTHGGAVVGVSRSF